MAISSRTSESAPKQCPACGTPVPVDERTPLADARCPNCGPRPMQPDSSGLSDSALLQSILGSHPPARQDATDDPAENARRWVKEIDRLVSAQLNEIMHDPVFQHLE